MKKFYRASFYQDKICSHFSFFFEALRLRVEGFLRILILFLGSAVLLHRVVTHLLGIFKGIIPYYTRFNIFLIGSWLTQFIATIC